MTDHSDWEFFQDEGYFGMWCVREKGARRFGEGFHTVSEEEAEALASALSSQSLSLSEAREEIERLKGLVAGIREAPAPQIETARKLMRGLFDGITDKGGKPYAEHCERVEAGLPDWVSDDARCAALLHDVVEDCGITGGDLRRMGFSDRAVWLVLMLSRMSKEITYIDWIKSIAATGDAELIAIKLSDNLDNSDPVRIAALPPDQRDIVRRYERARRILEPALENSKARLADAHTKSPDLDLSSLRKGAEVAVKPLEWVTHDPDCWYARCPVSSKEYYVIREDGRWWATWDLRIPAFDTAEEGKSAAQSDFETRIRSALVSGSREDGASLLRTIETLPDDFTDDGNCCAGKLKEPRP